MAKFGSLRNKGKAHGNGASKPKGVTVGSDVKKPTTASDVIAVEQVDAEDDAVSPDGGGTVQKSSHDLTGALISQLKSSPSDPLLDLGVIDEVGSDIAGTYSMDKLQVLSGITSLPAPIDLAPGEFTYASVSLSNTPNGPCERYFVMITLGCVEGKAIGIEAVEGTEQPYIYTAGISVHRYHDFDDKPVSFSVPDTFVRDECMKLPQGVFEVDGWERIASVLGVGLYSTPDQFHLVLYNALSRLIIEAQSINEQLGRKQNVVQ